MEEGWEYEIPRSKVHYINNGVDLEQFDYNRDHYFIEDPDLEDPNTFKVIYTGSLRQANRQIYMLMDAIALMQGDNYSDYRFMIYGNGDIQADLEQLCQDRNCKNVFFKGRVEKKYIPYILSCGDLNILNCKPNDILKYGGSQNKLFDYLASGKSIISGEGGKYSLVATKACGISRKFETPQDLVNAIDTLRAHPVSSEHIRSVAEEYDFRKLTEKLIQVIEGA